MTAFVNVTTALHQYENFNGISKKNVLFQLLHKFMNIS